MQNKSNVLEISDNDQKEPKGQGAKAALWLEMLETYLTGLGEWRFNLINGAHIFKPHGEKHWINVDQRLNNTIRREMIHAEHKQVSSQNFNDLVFSDFSKEINPVQDYFETLDAYLPGQDPDFIAQLSGSLTTHIGERFTHFFRKWLVASVANVFTEHQCTNHVCFTVLGEQGEGKSTFLNALIPKAISEYCYAGRINFKNDMGVNILLSQNFIVHIEESLGDIMEGGENDIKEMITRNKCTYVRKYDNVQREWMRMANVCASLNNDQFLTDSTGDRRYFVARMLSLDSERLKKIDIDNVWSQALHLFRSGFDYWLTREENAELQLNNQKFRVVSEETEAIAKLFNLHLGVDDSKQVATHRYTATEIANVLRNELRNNRFTAKSVGTSLGRMGLKPQQDRHDGGRYYYFTPIDKTDQDANSVNPHASIDIKRELEAKKMAKRAQPEEKGWKQSYNRQPNEFN